MSAASGTTAAAGCPWKGKRVWELDCKVEDWLGQVYAAASPHYTKLLQGLSSEDRCGMLTVEQALKASVVEGVRDKLKFLKTLPFNLFQVYACAVSLREVGECRATVVQCMSTTGVKTRTRCTGSPACFWALVAACARSGPPERQLLRTIHGSTTSSCFTP